MHRYLLGDKNNFGGATAFGIGKMEFTILDALGFQLQDFTDPHTTPCHQFKHTPISGALSFEDEFMAMVTHLILLMCQHFLRALPQSMAS